MDKGDFKLAVQSVLSHEGAFTDNPADNGGPTNYGITLDTLRLYRGTDVTKDDVRSLTVVEAMDIYKKLFWDKIRGDELVNPVAFMVFDVAVNSGVGLSIRNLQRAVGTTVDGVMGPKTLALTNCKSSPAVKQLLVELTTSRLLVMARHDDCATFGRGWFRRAITCYDQAAELLKGGNND